MSSRVAAAGADQPLIQVSRLAKHYQNGQGTITVLKEINLQVEPGDMVAIMGPSGSGKSTLLFILGLLLPPTRGTYLFAGRDVLNLDRTAQAEFRRHRVGLVFQSCDLLEKSTVYENLEFPLIYAGVDRRDRPPRIMAALERVKLTHRVRHGANLLSGGEKQRVAVARALVNQPQVILADEPTGQLDRENSHLIVDHFQEIAAAGGTAVVVVTHDPEIAARCSRKYLLQDGVLVEL
ncbi:MAG: ABC transporter ATP-binding protein [Deltaproteobacteria bacterium]|nr:ABC transporter ATP-binding protein [Deltaproteobacteria bacterium]